MTNAGALVRACRGPIVLIALGSLTAIDTFGQYSLTRTWPIILIVFGLLKLAEKTAESRGGDPYTPGPAAYANGPQGYQSPSTGFAPPSGSYTPPSQPVRPAEPAAPAAESPRHTEDQ